MPDEMPEHEADQILHEKSDTTSTAQKTKEVIKTSKKIADVAKNGAQAIQSALSAFLNPYTWVAIGVILALILAVLGFVSFIQVVGRTDNADGCYGIGGKEISVKNGTSEENMQSIASWAMSTNFKFMGGKAMSKEQIAGILGNVMEESNGDPSAVEPGQKHPEWSNEDAMGAPGGVGLVQWTADRKVKVVNYAKEKGKKWNDLNLQLDYWKTELDGAEGTSLAGAGFAKEGKSASEYAEIYNRTFERSADFSSKRGTHANELKDQIKGGSYTTSSSSDDGSNSNSGGSCQSGEGGGNVDTSDAAKLAYSLAWPIGDKDNISPNDPYGKNNVKPEYKTAKEKAMKEDGADGIPDLYASCDRFVATVTKLTMDKEIPWGPTSAQYEYLKGSNKWQSFDKLSEAKPGDIFVTKGDGHIIMFIGEKDGKVLVAHASFQERVAGLDEAKLVLNEQLVDNGGRSFQGFHFKGK